MQIRRTTREAAAAISFEFFAYLARLSRERRSRQALPVKMNDLLQLPRLASLSQKLANSADFRSFDELHLPVATFDRPAEKSSAVRLDSSAEPRGTTSRRQYATNAIIDRC
jgi:hypothetical protein